MGPLVLSSFLILIALPPAGATSPSATGVLLVAPFSGSVHTSSSPFRSGCAAVADTPRPAFHLITGKATLNGSARARSCALSAFGGDGRTDAVTTAQIPLPNRAGFSTVYVNLSYSFLVNLSITPGRCTLNRSASLTDCETAAEFNLSINAGVFDATAGSYVGSAGSWTDWVGIDNVTACYLGSCSSGNHSINGGSPGVGRYAASPSWIERLSPSMVRGHRYVLEVSVEAQAFADVYCNQASLVGARSAASLDLASAGNGVTVRSVLET